MGLLERCTDNNLDLKVTKKKEIIVDLRPNGRVYTSININGVSVEQWTASNSQGYRYPVTSLGVLTLMLLPKKAQPWLLPPLPLLGEKSGVTTKMFADFYRSTIESLLTGCTTVWYGSCSAEDCKLYRQGCKNSTLYETELPSVRDIYGKKCCDRAQKIVREPSHPASGLITQLPSGRHWKR